tara:strand:+ start:337 stop:525 length:189 start_codon:yes stop_codon:yes gene_type:complete
VSVRVGGDGGRGAAWKGREVWAGRKVCKRSRDEVEERRDVDEWYFDSSSFFLFLLSYPFSFQ